MDEQVADFETVEKAALKGIDAFQKSGVTVGNTILACGMIIGRLWNLEHELSDEEEVEFMQHLNEWVGAYFAGEMN